MNNMQDLLNLILIFSIINSLTVNVCGDCQDHEFKYAGGAEHCLSNNSFLLKNNLSYMYSVDGLCTEWYRPDNVAVPIDSDNGIFRVDSLKTELRRAESSCKAPNCQNGIYKCTKSNDDVIFLGLYNDFTSIPFQAKMDITFPSERHFSPVLSAYLDCITNGYPPTKVSWFEDNEHITNMNYTSTVIDAPTSVYLNRGIITVTDNITGPYYCEVNSSTVHHQIQIMSEPKYISDPPELSMIRFPDSSSVYLEWQHINHTTAYNHTISFKDNMATNGTLGIQHHKCGLANNCTVSNLTVNGNYSFVIAPSIGSRNVFQPVKPVEIQLTKPGRVEVHALNLLTNASDGSQVSLQVTWSPFSVETLVSIHASAVCGNDTILCWNKSISNIRGRTNVSLSSLTAGIPFSVTFVAGNVFGNGLETMFTINQEKASPLSEQLLIPVVNNVTITTITISWSPLTCCHFSGEDPLYTVSIIIAAGINDTDLITYNDTVEENLYTFYDLEPHTLYNVTIAMVNSIGTGDKVNMQIQTLSNMSTSGTTVAIPSTPDSTLPSFEPPSQSPLTLLISSVVVSVVALSIAVGGLVICMVVSIFIRSRRLRNKAASQNEAETMDLLEIDTRSRPNLLDAKHCSPYLIQFPTDTKATVGETVRFLVHAEGFPEPSLSWEYQGEPVTPVGPVQLFSDGTLVLHDVKVQYSGRYTFVAVNAAGMINRVVNLKVVEEGENEEDMEIERMMNCRSVVIENKPIPIGLFEAFVETHHASDNDPFQALFTSLLTYPETYSFTKANSNKDRNRYKNIIPYDDNIVELAPLPGWKDYQHTYINASYIDGYNTPNKFIATQGPKAETITDFWRMVKQERCGVIACLCNLHEANRVKCDQYWPKSTDCPEEHGPYVVQLLSEELFANFTVRSMEILLSNGSQDSHHVTQFHFTDWPDHGVPDHGSPLVLYYEKVLQCYNSNSIPLTPIIVHCSAGVGRTGTLIAYDIAMDQIREEGVVDCVGIVNRMREQRQKMIQTSQQLMFLHDVLLENALCGSTIISMNKLSETLESLYSVNPQSERTGFQTQFQLIQRLTPKPNKFKCTTAKSYIEKNRPNLALPSDTRRVILYGQTDDYINASYIDGYQQKKEFIIAQSPMTQTLTDFWQMLTQQKVSVIVMLCEEVENSKVVCERYWPLNSTEAEVFGCYSIKLLRQQQVSETITKRTLGVKDMNMGTSLVMTHVQFKDWLQDGQCANHQSIGSLYTEVLSSYQGATVAIHCSDSITRSAMYCATHMALDQARLEHVVDIFQIVKSLRMQRPGSIPSEENYITIHDFVKDYLTKFETYQI